MNIIGRRNIFFAASAIIIIPGTIALIFWGLKLGIDFTGGSLMEISGTKDSAKVAEVARKNVSNVSVIKTGDDALILKFKETDEATHQKLKDALKKDVDQQIKEDRFESVGPTVSRELTKKAFLAIGLAALAIILYLSWAFRKVSRPVSSWKYGFCAIAALLHDVLLVTSVFAILGHFFNIEVDSYFITAMLTVIGFSVHDSIVVFDRVRENLRLMAGKEFGEIVNYSVVQTLARSINTSLTVLLVLVALYLFGGTSISHFILALLIGIASGTYSSIFNASPLLVVWHNFTQKRARKRLATA